MSRQSRVDFHLDAKGLEPLSPADIRAILRGADPLIDQGGRTLLVKILKGSRDREVVSRGLDRNPAYGFYRSLTAEQVLARIDWTILHGYLRVVYVGRLPVLIYTALGWSIECDAYADELVRSFDQLLQSAGRLQESPAKNQAGHRAPWRQFEVQRAKPVASTQLLFQGRCGKHRRVHDRRGALIREDR
jgi:hypothetical protein